MPRRKKKGNYFNFILIALAIMVGGYIALDFYLNVYRHPQKSEPVSETAITPSVQKQELSVKKEEAAPESKNGFALRTYRDDRYGFEFQYPVFSGNDPQCPVLAKTDDGLSVGIFSFIVSDRQGAFEEFVVRQLEGMEIDGRTELTVGGKPAVRADYQTAGMGWSGSSVFIDDGKKFIEFGLLANESGERCGNSDDYEDRVYQSVISTLKFTN